MRTSLQEWISEADALRQLDHFGLAQASIELGHVRSRADSYYISLVGELFDLLRATSSAPSDWSRLGNALSQFSLPGWADLALESGVSPAQAALFGSAAYYCGGFPASAYVVSRAAGNDLSQLSEVYRACFELLARPPRPRSKFVRRLLTNLEEGNLVAIGRLAERVDGMAVDSLDEGPESWIPLYLLSQLMRRFQERNVRRVLPDGETDFWTPFVKSLLDRRPATWEFFPSQMEAIDKGLVLRPESFALQMPTGAGKTTLCETLLYWSATRSPSDVAILLVPYRALASELRVTMASRLAAMGIRTRCAYAGTVPCGTESRDLDDVSVLIATPESMSGLLSANPDLLHRVSLVICDEGHLLDANTRGVGLELLLARLKARDAGSPRFVFLSAIVPNVDEINAWLGGTDETVLESDYRPALAEYALLQTSGSGASATVSLTMHPQESSPTRYSISGFLGRSDFQFLNPRSGRFKTYDFSSLKTRSVATARKALSMGASVVFAANKRGNAGAIGLAEELLKQLNYGLAIPRPIDHAELARLSEAVEYMSAEYGAEWVGTRCVEAGAVLHHGDVPQETREVVESLLHEGSAKFAICTNTLAEGVNFPVRTLVLYSVKRKVADGAAIAMFTRDIKNLVGRAGRPGATTKGLVVCTNPGDWPLVEAVANQARGENVVGALRRLVAALRRWLADENHELTNSLMEGQPALHELTDGIDAALIDLASEEIGQEALEELALRVANETFAVREQDERDNELLRRVFTLRAARVSGLVTSGRLAWVRETGARARMIDIVEDQLLPSFDGWESTVDPIDPSMVAALFGWAWQQDDVEDAARYALSLKDEDSTDDYRDSVFRVASGWLSGARYGGMAEQSGLTVDQTLAVQASVVGFVLQTHVEQGIALLEKLLAADDQQLADSVMQFSDHLRFGVPGRGARVLCQRGLRHRHAAVNLGAEIEPLTNSDEPEEVGEVARHLLLADEAHWVAELGRLVYERTLKDLASAITS